MCFLVCLIGKMLTPEPVRSLFGGSRPTLVKQGFAASFWESSGDQIQLTNPRKTELHFIVLGAFRAHFLCGLCCFLAHSDLLLRSAGKPLRELYVWQGPFVVASQQQLAQGS